MQLTNLAGNWCRSANVQMDSFLFDDGWDDNKTLWQFHSGFPHGFTPLKTAAAGYHAGIGVWISPFGGYGAARQQRLQYAGQLGYETNESGFSLAGPEIFRSLSYDLPADDPKIRDQSVQI